MTIGIRENNLKNHEETDASRLQQLSSVVFQLLNSNASKEQLLRNDALMLLSRRRTVARMIRIELEVAVGILNKALEYTKSNMVT